MGPIKRCAVGLGLALAVAIPASAEVYRYQCAVPPHNSGYITATYIIDVDSDAGTVRVLDALSNHYNEGSPVDGTIAEYTTKKQVFRWEVRTRDTRGQLARMSFRAAVFLNNMSVRIEAVPLGYSNRFERRGSCQRVATG